MKAEIIAVGSEMLTPDHLDTNSLFITERLNENGFRVRFKIVVGDDRGDIMSAVQAAMQRAQLVIVTGGLGPTEDDLTRGAVAEVLGREVRIDPEIVESLRRRFASRGYSMPSINERQAEVIEGAEVLRNPVGTAPGMWIEHGGCCLALLPGPPREARPMLEHSVLPRAARLTDGTRLARRSIYIAGMTESEVDSRAAPIYSKYPDVQTTILAGTGQITLRLESWANQNGEAPVLDELADELQECLGDPVFSTRGEALEEVVGRMLRDSRRTLAVAESCTSGMLAARITRVPGSSDYFRGGVLCYSNDAKVSLCGVRPETLASVGAVSAEVAEALAQGVRSALGSSVGVAITGIAGPGGGTPERPVGLAYVGVADEVRAVHFRRILPGDREMVRERAAFMALASLRRFLLEEQR